jgi:hypothetical protein
VNASSFWPAEERNLPTLRDPRCLRPRDDHETGVLDHLPRVRQRLAALCSVREAPTSVLAVNNSTSRGVRRVVISLQAAPSAAATSTSARALKFGLRIVEATVSAWSAISRHGHDSSRPCLGDRSQRLHLQARMALAREGRAGGKVRFWVVELGGEGKVGSTSTQRIKLTLTPTLGARMVRRRRRQCPCMCTTPRSRTSGKRSVGLCSD